MQAIIIGAGIGGLTAALCLQRIGWQVTVYEQAQQLVEVGAGIQISPNGSRVLDALGLTDYLAPHLFEPERIDMRWGLSGGSIFSIPLKEQAVDRWGAPYWHLHRADLVAVLSQALVAASPKALRLGVAVSGYAQPSGPVVVNLSNGEQSEADVLIGADGIHSTLRTQMLGADKPRFTGNVAWRMTVPTDKLGRHVPPPTACIWAGAKRHAVTYLLQGGRLANLVGVVEQSDWQRESWTEQGTREDAIADFVGWHPVITEIIRQADAHYRWALFDREPLDHWVDGNVALLGDACHPMLPFLAQGAVMAIEDAWVLADSIKGCDAGNLGQALQGYQTQRLARTAKVQREAAANQRRFHYGFRPAYWPLQITTKLMPNLLHRRQDWLYGHSVI